ncbi:sensor histidine kinase [Jannaschia sp. R86511]|uniref:sensor histidine kinase n=1 Tax=Jannaschia sp. R86511 TaxID=3093853 RepID=UPI0036D2EC18
MTARLAGVLVVLTAPAWVGSAVVQQPLLAPWWNLLALVVVGGPALWLVVASWRIADVRPPSVALAAGVALCLLLWSPGVVDVGGAEEELPWLWLVLPPTLGVLATVGSVPLSAAYGVLVGVVYAVLRLQAVGGSTSTPVAVLEAFLLLTLAVGPAVLVVGSARAAARLDAIADDAARASALASRAAAALATQRELDAVVHDTVLAALHTAVRAPRAPELPQLAARALETFGSERHGLVDGRRVSSDEVGRRLQASLSVVAPDADLDVRPGPDVPPEVATALVDAALEAARNARRHGGGAGSVPDIGVVLAGTADGRGLDVVVADDGVGFDPSLVPPQRMGLAVSVRDRMVRVGGRAEVVTATGSGTTVRLRWPEDAS